MGDLPTLAVVGATGAVGTVMCDLLSSRKNVWGEIRLLASKRSVGRRLVVRGNDVSSNMGGIDLSEASGNRIESNIASASQVSFMNRL